MNGSIDPLAGLQSLNQGVPHFPNRIMFSTRRTIYRVIVPVLAWDEYSELGGSFTSKGDSPFFAGVCNRISRCRLLNVLFLRYRLAEVRPEDRQEGSAGDGPENNPQYTTVYVGNLAHEVWDSGCLPSRVAFVCHSSLMNKGFYK
jgi:hypothetical protein